MACFTKAPTPGVQMKKLLFIVCLFASSSAFATTAFWTGNKEKFETDKGETNWKCEYRVAYTTQMMLVWRTFPYACPAEIEIEVDGD
jgi:hypothetical protein